MQSREQQTVPLLYRYGLHRVIEPAGSLPQGAARLRAGFGEGGGADWEIEIQAETLNIDSASFRQLEEAAQAAGERIEDGVGRRVEQIVAARGKMHNPVTGSGGMLLGRVRGVGAGLRAAGIGGELVPGARVATLVSLTLTPLRLLQITAVKPQTHQIDVAAEAVLFASGAWAVLPGDLPEGLVLSALDVAGAGPQVARQVRKVAGSRVLVLGCGGKSGLLCAAAARRAGAALVVGLESHEAAARDAEELGACAQVLRGDARDGLGVAQAALSASGGQAYDLVVSCVNVEGAEMGAILATRPGGTVYFFSMSTSFTRAALGAEGVSQDIDMLVGNGYCAGHAEETLALLREDPALRRIFLRRYA